MSTQTRTPNDSNTIILKNWGRDLDQWRFPFVKLEFIKYIFFTMEILTVIPKERNSRAISSERAKNMVGFDTRKAFKETLSDIDTILILS